MNELLKSLKMISNRSKHHIVNLLESNAKSHLLGNFIKVAVIFLVNILFFFRTVWGATEEPLPNIVLILADDFGYGSVNCYHADPSVVQTPNIDKIAERGVRFTDANTLSSICTPTRYGLLMGRYPWRTRLKSGVINVGDPLLPDPSRTSLASWLQERGYRTASIGKWHLGYTNKEHRQPKDWTGILRPGALELGFDYHFAVPQNHGDITGVYIENDRIYGLESKKVYPYSRSFYGKPYFGFDAPQRVNKEVMQTLTDKAVHWLENQRDNQPFFLYFAPVAVHHPITPSDRMRGESGSGPYGDFIQDIDISVGRILRVLNEMGIYNKTIFIFTSDNGGDIPGDSTRPERQAMKLGLKINGSLKGDKHTIWEGGVRVPFIFSWPERIPAGVVSKTMINLVDVFATIADIIEGEEPDPEQATPDGFSFKKALFQNEGTPISTRPSMVVGNAHGILAIRKGPWKYIEGKFPPGFPEERRKRAGDQAKRQLYNLDTDPAEQKDVIGEFPKVAEQLQEELNAIRNAESSRKLWNFQQQ